MNLSRRSFIGATTAALLAGPGHASPGMHRLGGPALGSYWTVLVPDTVSDRKIQQAIVSLLIDTDRLFSPYRKDSEISRFNRLPAGESVAFSPETRCVINSAMGCHDRTGGAFDPTVGPIVARFGFGPIEGSVGTPFRSLEIGAHVTVKPGDHFTLDLCGIAKGWALDQIVSTLDVMGVNSFLVELGGEAFARGHTVSGRPWRILIDTPEVSPAYILELRDGAVATSGLRPQTYNLATAQYSHIVDPRRQAPVPNGPNAVSVLSPAAIDADALATALMAMDLNEAIKFSQAQNLNAVIFGQGEVHRFGSPALMILE